MKINLSYRIAKTWKSFAALTVTALILMACAGVAATPASFSPNDLSTIVAATIKAITAKAPTLIPPTFAAPTLQPASTKPSTSIAATTVQSIPATVATSISPTVVMPTSVPTFPPAPPTQPLPTATRINFLTGATTGVATGTIQLGTMQNFVVGAMQGQLMIMNVDAMNHDVTASIRTQGGTSLLNASSKQSSWQGPLPSSEDYYITIYGGAAEENFTIFVEIPARIKFAAGADTYKTNGVTAGGYTVAYAIFASKDQVMTVDVSSSGSQAALTIYGFSNGQPYIRSVTGATHHKFTLPMTQDYIIEVVPMAGQTVSYFMSVQVK